MKKFVLYLPDIEINNFEKRLKLFSSYELCYKNCLVYLETDLTEEQIRGFIGNQSEIMSVT
jgi:hypothetical protein